FVYDYFNQYLQPEQAEIKTSSTANEPQNKINVAVEVPKVVKPLSTKWRITGELRKNNQAFVILSDNQGRLRLEPRSQFIFSGRMLQGEIDNQIVNY
ncbi:hypothetical protein ACN9OU_12115, partial [Glaesserella parasuis]